LEPSTAQGQGRRSSCGAARVARSIELDDDCAILDALQVEVDPNGAQIRVKTLVSSAFTKQATVQP